MCYLINRFTLQSNNAYVEHDHRLLALLIGLVGAWTKPCHISVFTSNNDPRVYM